MGRSIDISSNQGNAAGEKEEGDGDGEGEGEGEEESNLELQEKGRQMKAEMD